jgi:photosystem II stability/assembly factor-like uncharacterized protein/spore coat protein CotH
MKKFYYLFGLSVLFTVYLFAQVPQYSVTMTPADYDLLYTRDIWSDVFLNSPFKSHDTLWSGATIHFKGHSTRYFPKKAYRVRFKTNNLFYGLRDVNFNPMYTDKSNMREKLAWDLFAEMKTVAPFCYHAGFSINGESKGLFSFIDKFNKYFLTMRGLPLGNLYEASDTYIGADLTVQPDSLIKLYYDINMGDTNYTDLKALIQAVNDASPSQFAETATQYFDTSSVLNWFCGNTITMMGDSYNKNYALYHDTTRVSQQWVVIPWDYDLSWGRSGDLTKPYPSSLLNDGFACTYPPLSGPSNVLKDRWMATPRLAEMFRSRLKFVLDSIFTETRYHNKIDSLKTLIENEVANDNYKWGTIQDFYEHVEALKYYVTVRRNYLYKTFINPPNGMYNIVTLPITQTDVPYHFVTYDGRTIATMWFSSIIGLDSINVRAYPDSTPPFISNPADERFIKRWLKITPYPSNAQFTAKLQFMYQDIQANDREVGAGVQDERLLRAGSFNGTYYESLPTKINSYANTVTIEHINNAQVGNGKYVTAMMSDTYTQKWFKKPNYFWQRLCDVKFSGHQNGYTLGDQGTFFKTTDGGTHWADRAIGMNVPFFKFVNPTPNTFFAVGEFGSLYNSVDTGNTWTKVQISTKANLRSIVMNSHQLGWIAGDSGHVAVTLDSGKTWNADMLDSGRYDFYGLAISNNNYAMVVGEKGSIYFTTVAGIFWEQRFPNVTTNLYAVKNYSDPGFFVVGDSGTVLATADNGITWNNISIPTSTKLKDLFVLNANNIYVVGEGGKIFYTNNGGANWYSQYSADSHDLNAITFVDSAYGIAVGNSATVLKTTESGTLTGFKEPLVSIPADFKLDQNYPNPFNPTTIINYQLPISNYVSLKVYDILGREVQTLVSEYKKMGKFFVEFNGSNLASGVYFYQLRIGSQFVQTKKLMLLR